MKDWKVRSVFHWIKWLLLVAIVIWVVILLFPSIGIGKFNRKNTENYTHDQQIDPRAVLLPLEALTLHRGEIYSNQLQNDMTWDEFVNLRDDSKSVGSKPFLTMRDLSGLSICKADTSNTKREYYPSGCSRVCCYDTLFSMLSHVKLFTANE